MSNQEILEKAIQKAIDGGWNYRKWPFLSDYISDNLTARDIAHMCYDDPAGVIFNHDFAEALWGEEPLHEMRQMNWAYHLQQMVIADDPIKYLGEHLDA